MVECTCSRRSRTAAFREVGSACVKVARRRSRPSIIKMGLSCADLSSRPRKDSMQDMISLWIGANSGVCRILGVEVEECEALENVGGRKSEVSPSTNTNRFLFMSFSRSRP
jgi:hypothetical protein